VQDQAVELLQLELYTVWLLAEQALRLEILLQL
jgi:hypothetical protein